MKKWMFWWILWMFFICCELCVVFFFFLDTMMKLHIVLSLRSFSIYTTDAVVKPHQREWDDTLLVFRIISWFFGFETIDFHEIFGWIILVCTRCCLYYNRNHFVDGYQILAMDLPTSSSSSSPSSSLKCVMNRGTIELLHQMLLSQRYSMKIWKFLIKNCSANSFH